MKGFRWSVDSPCVCWFQPTHPILPCSGPRYIAHGHSKPFSGFAVVRHALRCIVSRHELTNVARATSSSRSASQCGKAEQAARGIQACVHAQRCEHVPLHSPGLRPAIALHYSNKSHAAWKGHGSHMHIDWCAQNALHLVFIYHGRLCRNGRLVGL